MKKISSATRPEPPEKLFQWIEFVWLCIFDRRFRASPNKRKLYYERCMVKSFDMLFY